MNSLSFKYTHNLICLKHNSLKIVIDGLRLREEPHTDPHPPLKKMIPTLSWQTPTLSSRRLQVFYLIPGSGVVRLLSADLTFLEQRQNSSEKIQKLFREVGGVAKTING